MDRRVDSLRLRTHLRIVQTVCADGLSMKNIGSSTIRLSVYVHQRTGMGRSDHLRTLRSEICIPGLGLTRKPVDPGGGDQGAAHGCPVPHD